VTRVAVRRRRRSDAILASAVAAFGRHGYHGTSMSEIADSLQLTKGSLYHYFENKADILYAAHDRSLERMQRALERIAISGADPATQLREIVVEHVRAMVGGFQGTALALELDALPDAARRRIVAQRDQYERGLRRILEQGVAGGDFRAVDPALVGFAIFGAVNWIARWYRPDGGADAGTVGRCFADLFLRGVVEPTDRRLQRSSQGRHSSNRTNGRASSPDPRRAPMTGAPPPARRPGE